MWFSMDPSEITFPARIRSYRYGLAAPTRVLWDRYRFSVFPTVPAQPRFKIGELRVDYAQSRNLRLITVFNEPFQHLLRFRIGAAHGIRRREVDWTPYDAAEYLGNLRLGQFIPGDLKRLADIFLSIGEGERYERANILHSDILDGAISG